MAASRVSDLYRTAFITGASTGLGRAFAEMLLADGVRVWGTSRDEARLAELSRSYGSNFTPIALDLRNAADAVDAWSSANYFFVNTRRTAPFTSSQVLLSSFQSFWRRDSRSGFHSELPYCSRAPTP